MATETLTANDILLAPIVTEKTTYMASDKKYTFLVPNWATKNHVKEAFAQAFPNRKVLKINMATVFGSSKRTAKGRKGPRDRKKAIITIDGEHIDYFPEV